MQGHVVGQQLLHCYKLLGSDFAGQLCSDRGECRRQDDGTLLEALGQAGSIRLAALAELLISAEAAVVLVMVAVVPGGTLLAQQGRKVMAWYREVQWLCLIQRKLIWLRAGMEKDI